MNKLLIFVVGATLGSAATWYILKDRYKKIADEEIASVKEMYSKKNQTKKEESIGTQAKNNLNAVNKIIESNGYKLYSNNSKPEIKDEQVIEPYVISPEEAGENGYEIESFVYWSDGVITNESNYPVDSAEGLIGNDALNHFGEYDDDSVYVRNDETCMDYEILMDTRRFRDLYPDRLED